MRGGRGRGSGKGASGLTWRILAMPSGTTREGVERNEVRLAVYDATAQPPTTPPNPTPHSPPLA